MIVSYKLKVKAFISNRAVLEVLKFKIRIKTV